MKIISLLIVGCLLAFAIYSIYDFVKALRNKHNKKGGEE